MGYLLAWVAVRGKPAEALRSHLNLHSVGEPIRDTHWCDVQVPGGSLIGATLKSGWYLLLADHDDAWIERFTDGSTLPRLSRGAEAVTCFLYEGMMTSQATGWSNGRERWDVSYDGSNGRGQFEVWGETPPELASIRAECEREQRQATGSKVDYLFDAPVLLAESLVGFARAENHQYLPGLEHVDCEVLAKGPRRPFWARLLGRSAGR